MTTSTTTTLPAGEWTEIHTAAGAETVALQNMSGHIDLRYRIDAAAATSDAVTAPHNILRPVEFRAETLASGDVLLAMPVGESAGALVHRV